MAPRTLAHYVLLQKLGGGAMGEVYVARDDRLGRKVALKLLTARLADEVEGIARFEREAKALAALNHPNITTIHSVEESDGLRFLTMELLEGATLDRMIPPGGLELERILELAIPMTDALAAAHGKGVRSVAWACPHPAACRERRRLPASRRHRRGVPARAAAPCDSSESASAPGG